MSIIERMPLRALCAGKIQTQRVSVLGQAPKLASSCTGVDRSLLTTGRRTSSPLPQITDSQNILSVRGHCPDCWAFSDPTQPPSCAGVVSTRSPDTIQLFTRKTWWLRGQSLVNAYRHSDSNQPPHIRRCLRRAKPQQKAIELLGSPPFRAQKASNERPWNMG